MQNSRNFIYQFASVLLFLTVILLWPSMAEAAPRSNVRKKVVGVVTDSVSGERLAFVNVYSKQAKAGTTTDERGVFVLHVPQGTLLEASSLGYTPMKKKTGASRDTLRFKLQPSNVDLQEVVIRPKKQKYSKKNNPAVELMRRVRQDHDKVNARRAPYYSYDQYDKMVLAFNDYQGYLPDSLGNVKGSFKSLAELVDTGVWTGKRILDLSMKEKSSTRLHTAEGTDKQIVSGQRANGVDKMLDEGYTRVMFENLLREVDVYENDIPVMLNRFVSPLSGISADYYMFHIEDTVQIGNDRCVELSFAPHNPESMGFNGKLYIPVNDSVKWVRRVMMRLPKAANVNYVESMTLSQTFNRDSLGYVQKTLDDMVVELHVAGSFGRGYMARQSRFYNPRYDRRTEFDEYYDKIGNEFLIDGADKRDAEFWTGARMLPLSHAESMLAADHSPYDNYPLIKWTIRLAELFVKGYVRTGKESKFDFGPIDTFLSTNSLEGWRVSVGGMTTANLCKYVFGRGYVAYGFGDKKWKYNAELAISFKPKKYSSFEFPMNGFRLTYRYDTNNIGQNYMTGSGRNLLNSFKRTGGNLATYERFAQLKYEIEWRNNLSLNASINHQRQESSKYVPFILADGTSVGSYTQNSLKLQLRYAPGEKFMQTNHNRHNVHRDNLVLTLTQTIGPKGWLGSEFMLNATELCVEKRFYLPVVGYTDFIVKGGKLWSQVQFPALMWQNANIAYTVQRESFCLLNPMEFAMDEYVMLDFLWNMNGLIFNRIPLIKKLGLREIVCFRGFAGHLTDRNNPALHDNLYQFPAGDRTQAMGRTPYMEVSVGIANILTFIRLDYVWRLSYRNKPHCPDSGLRFALQFAF